MLTALRDFIRPLTVAALIFVLLTGALTSGILQAIWPGAGVQFTGGVAGWFKAIPDAYYNLTLAVLLGYTAGRTVEKVAHRSASPVDNPDGDDT